MLRGAQVPLIYSPVYVFVPSSSSYLWAVIALLSKDVRSSLPYQATVGDISLHSRSLWTPPPVFSNSGMLPYVNQAVGYKSLSRDLLSAQVGESASSWSNSAFGLSHPCGEREQPAGEA